MLNTDSVKYNACTGVYSPAEDTHLLARSVSGRGRVLEMGTGTGVIAIACALNGATVTAADKFQAALDCCRKNAELNGVSVRVVNSDLFENIEGKFDEIVFNPPYLPTEDSIQESEQWDGGKDGFTVIRPFLSDAPAFLNPGGAIRIILSDMTDIGQLKSEFTNLRFAEEGNEKFDFETIYAFTITTET